MQDILSQIRSELGRVGARNVSAELDDDFEPEAGTLVKITLDDEAAYWHLLPGEFLDLLKDLPAKAGSEAVKTAIETKGTNIWRGPAPKSDRDVNS